MEQKEALEMAIQTAMEDDAVDEKQFKRILAREVENVLKPLINDFKERCHQQLIISKAEAETNKKKVEHALSLANKLKKVHGGTNGH
jgi:hypothetical protein